MKIAVEFPSVVYREGPEGAVRLAKAIEDIGYDQLDVFDHVVMGHPTDGRPAGPYPPKMPILEALMTLAYCAAVTRRIGLGTEVLVLPQRHPTLVAKQISTLDTLSGGRVRLGVGVGWQESEYDAQGVDFHQRGARMDEAIALLRRYWSEDPVDAPGPVLSDEGDRDGAQAAAGSEAADLDRWLGAGRAAARRSARRRVARRARGRRPRAGAPRRRHRQAPRRGGGSRSGGARLPVAGGAAAAQRRRRRQAILGRAAAGGRRRRAGSARPASTAWRSTPPGCSRPGRAASTR